MAKKLATVEKIDPTLPFIPITLDGTTYKMCLDFGAVARAEAELAPQLGGASLLHCSWNLTMLSTAILFAVSLRIHHPEIPFDEAKRLVTWENAGDICLAIREAQKQFAPVPEAGKKEGPPKAPES